MTILNSTQNSNPLSFDDSSISTFSDSDNEEISENRLLAPALLQPERPIRRPPYSYTIFTRLESGSIVPFSFTFDRRPNVAAHFFARESPSDPFYYANADTRIAHSFRTTPNKNVKVLITRGRYKNQHGVIVKSYVLRKSSHRVLTTDGAVTTLKQFHLRRLDPNFWLPYGVPVDRL